MINPRIRNVLSLMLPLCFLVTGCATVKGEINTDRFQAFTESIQNLKQGTQQAAQGLVPIATENFNTELKAELTLVAAKAKANEDEEAQDPPVRDTSPEDRAESNSDPTVEPEVEDNLCHKSHVRDLYLHVKDDNSFEFSCVPTYLIVEQFVVEIGRVLDALSSYGQALQQLAASELSDLEFETKTEEIDGGVKGALKTIMPDEALFIDLLVPDLTAAVKDWAQVRVKNKQIDEISARVVASRDWVVAVGDQMQLAVELINTYYNNEWGAKHSAFFKKALNEETRDDAIKEFLPLVRSRVDTIAELRRLHDAFGYIVEAHDSLAVDTSSGNGLEGIGKLLSVGNQLKASYQQGKINQAKSRVQAEADKASTLADMVQAEALRVRLDAEKANAALVAAEIEATGTNDPDTLKRVEEIRTEVKALRELAAQKLEETTRLREAALALQAAAQAVKENIARGESK